MVSKLPEPVALPDAARLVVPVMAAVGGSGRSTTAALLADELAACGSTVVLDLAPRLSSPWPAHVTGQQATGLAGLPPDQPLSPAHVRQACATSGTPGAAWQVLTDTREWHTPPLVLPDDPAAWYQLAAIGGWQAVVADTAHPLAHDILSGHQAEPARTRGWYDLPYTVPVLCAAATADGIRAIQQGVNALHAEGLALHRTVVVLVATADSRPPPAVRAGATMLSASTAAVITLPHDPGIRAHGAADHTKLRSGTRHAAARLAHTVLNTAHAAWGDPLPAAPQPAPGT